MILTPPIDLSEYVSQNAIGQKRHNKTGCNNAQSDKRKRLFNAHVQHGGDQSASPSAGTGKGDGDEQEKTQLFVFCNFRAFLFGLFFNPMHELYKAGVFEP